MCRFVLEKWTQVFFIANATIRNSLLCTIKRKKWHWTLMAVKPASSSATSSITPFYLYIL